MNAIMILTDFVAMAENEIQRIKTGYAPGPSMRDCVGQWEATVREAKQFVSEQKAEIAKRKADYQRWLDNPDGPQAG